MKERWLFVQWEAKPVSQTWREKKEEGGEGRLKAMVRPCPQLASEARLFVLTRVPQTAVRC